MEHRRLGASGLHTPVLSFGAGTFGGHGPLFGAWGDTDDKTARRLVDICLDAGVTMFDTADVYSAVVWSPLGWGRLTGKVRRGQPLPEPSRLHATAGYGPPVDDELLYTVVDVLNEIAEETGKAVPQIAINWLLTRPTVSSVIIGARDERQLRQNLGAVGWRLSDDQIARLDAASAKTSPYPYFPYHRQEGFALLNPPSA